MDDRIKRTNDELKANRPTLDEVEAIPRLPISILVENVRSVHNVREDLSKTSLGAEKAVPWEHFKNPLDAAKSILKQGISLVLLEQTVKSKPIYDIDWSFPVCFIVGNEVTGVTEELSKLATVHAEIPMRGVKQSLNVSVATGVAGYEFSRIYSSIRK